GFSFIPGTPGTRSILVNIYYHMDQDSVRLSTQAQFTMHVADAKPGLGFLSTRIDTVYSSASTFAVTYDRVLTQDTIFLTDSVSVYDSVRLGANGIDNVYLTACDSVYVTQIVADGVLGDDRFTIYGPKGSFPIKAGDTIPVDLVYIPVTQTPKSRTVTVRFFTSDGKVSVIKLTVIVKDPASGVEDERGRVTISSPALTGAPNPFRNITTLQVTLGHAARVRLTVADALGGEVARLVDGDLEAGAHNVSFDATGLPAGTYFARMETGGRIVTTRLVLIQ
ncbi:MAG: T9SS type A sorting domain-containing protein, partial [Bacteroidota bacterium]